MKMIHKQVKDLFILRRRFFSLIEVLISLALMSIILTTLSYFYYQVNLLHIASQKEQSKAFRLRYAESRLGDTLPKTVSPKDPLNDFYFYTSTSSESIYQQGSHYLVFTFDNCVNLVDPLFSNHVLGQIFVDNKKNLTLSLAPSPNKWETNQPVPVQREVLLENVESISFELFAPPEHTNQNDPSSTTEQEVPETTGGWVQEWKQSYNRLPAIVKILLKMTNNETKILVFPLANVEQDIVYRS